MPKLTEAQIKKIVAQELAKGASPRQIVEHAKAAGISLGVIQQILAELVPQEKTSFTPEEGVFWCPFTGKITSKDVSLDNEHLEKELRRLKKHPKRPFLWFLVIIFVALPAAVLAGLFIYKYTQKPDLGVLLPGLAFSGLVFYWSRIKALERDMIKYLWAKQKGWLYKGALSPTWGMRFYRLFSKLFPFNQSTGISVGLEDHIWGRKEGVDFYAGLVQSSVRTVGSGRNTKRKNYTFQTLILRLPKPLKSGFYLIPKGKMGWLGSLFTARDAATSVESEAFNETFQIYLRKKDPHAEFEVKKVLSPAVQENLLRTALSYTEMRIAFYQDQAVFFLPGSFLEERNCFLKTILKNIAVVKEIAYFLCKGYKTNFFKKPEIHPADVERMDKVMENFFAIGKAIHRYLD